MTFTTEPDRLRFRYVLSVDIGIHHLALVLLELHRETYDIHDVVWFELVDITRFQHLDATHAKQCPLAHTKTVADWLAHLFALNQELFDTCDHILIERQPPGGQLAVEQLFFFHFRQKAILIHPRSVHRFFGWIYSAVDNAEERYAHRKIQSTKVLRRRLGLSPRSWLLCDFDRLARQHDLADAYCQAVFFAYCENQCAQRARHVPESDDLSELESFRFKLYADVN